MAARILQRSTPAPAANRDSELYTVIGIFLVLATIALGLRYTSKRILRKPLRIDDYLVVVAYVRQCQSRSHFTADDRQVILVAEGALFISSMTDLTLLFSHG